MSAIWRMWPPALLHFIFIESWPIPLSAYLFNKLINDANVKFTLEYHDIHTAPIYDWYQSKLALGHAPEELITFNSGRPVHLPEYTFSTLKSSDMIWFFAGWILYINAALLFVSVICVFFYRGHACRSFEDGAYVSFAWRLPRERWYKGFVIVMMVVAIALPVVWFGQIMWYYREGAKEGDRRLKANLLAFEHSWFTGAGFFFSLVKLGAFRFRTLRDFTGLLFGKLPEAPPYWHVRRASDCIRTTRLSRPMPYSFFESSATLGMKLLDALWCAQNGDLGKLQNCLSIRDHTGKRDATKCLEAAIELLEECQIAQRKEGEERSRRGQQELLLVQPHGQPGPL